MKIVLLFGVLVLSPGCRSPSAAEHPSFAKPTASEVFNLRSKCAELGQKIMNGNLIGSALAQDQVSHYEPKTNRCYVELDVHMADLTRYADYNSRYLYDGQTGELLASVTTEKGVKSAFVKDGGLKTLDYGAAVAKLDTLMADDRKQ